MSEPVQQSARQPLGTEHLGPLVERKVGDSARNDYGNGMPAAHTLFQVKSLALIANARKYHERLHFPDRSVPGTPP